MLRSRAIAASLFILASVASCHAYVEPAPEPVGYAEITYAPAPVEETEIYTYPSVVYEGRPHYYVSGRWWYRDGSRWAYYRNAPPALERQRDYVQAAPRAPRRERPVREVPLQREAPPAERVR
jgi:hypothetical protein